MKYLIAFLAIVVVQFLFLLVFAAGAACMGIECLWRSLRPGNDAD